MCPLCNISPCTLGHLLSNCKEALDRYEWRHNNIVNYLLKEFASQGLEGRELYADLEGKRINGVTIPPDVAMTAQKPDLVIINRKANPPEVTLVELTVPWDSSANMGAALQRKTDRYNDLKTTIEGNGFKCSNLPLEIGTRGFINARNKSLLTHLCNTMKVKKVSQVTKMCSKLAVLGSLECKIFRRLECRRLSGCLRAGNNFPLTPSYWYPVTFAFEALRGQYHIPSGVLCYP